MHSKNYKRTNKNKGTKEKMNKSGIITTHGFTLNLFLSTFFIILIYVNKKKVWKVVESWLQNVIFLYNKVILHQLRAKDLWLLEKFYKPPLLRFIYQ